MSRTILSLILAFGLLSCISAVSGAPDAYANDFIKKFAGKYYNSTNTTTPAEDKNATDVEAAAPNPACAQTLNKTNDAIAQFAESVGTAKDKWSLLGSISRLSGQSYSLGFNCKPEDLKLVNSGEVGVNKTQDEACDKLIEIIQPLLIKSKDDTSATDGFEKSLSSSQQALGISKKLGDKCQVSLIDTTQKAPEEEEVEEEIEEEEEDLEEEEESINEELVEEKEEEEEEESYDLIVQVVDEEGNLETIYYGFPDIEIDLDADSVEENIEQEAEAEEEEEEAAVEASLISFVQTKAPQNKPSPNPNPNPWSSVDYQGKYSTGGAGGNYTALNAF